MASHFGTLLIKTCKMLFWSIAQELLSLLLYNYNFSVIFKFFWQFSLENFYYFSKSCRKFCNNSHNILNFGLRCSSTLRKKNELLNMGQDVCMFYDRKVENIYVVGWTQGKRNNLWPMFDQTSKVFGLIDVHDDKDKQIVMDVGKNEMEYTMLYLTRSILARGVSYSPKLERNLLFKINRL